MIYQQGTAINLVERFYLVNALTGVKTLADPTIVTFRLTSPSDVTTTYTFPGDTNITNPSVGVFICLLSSELEVGVWRWAAEGDGAVEAASGDNTFEIVASDTPALLDTGPPEFGPCSSWVTGFDANECGPSLTEDVNELDDAAFNASAILFEATGRMYPGVCVRKVRPCRDNCTCWHDLRVDGWAWAGVAGTWVCGTDRCGCGSDSVIPLAGIPARKVHEVKIDGVVMPELDDDDWPNWKLRDQELVRMDLPGTVRRWPSCQNTSLPDSEEGTFSITYSWGVDPPQLGRDAAAALARELFKACGGGDGKCALPTKVTRVVRAGVTIESAASVAGMIRTGSSGIQLVDAFIAMVNPRGMTRRPAVWSPDVQPFPIAE